MLTKDLIRFKILKGKLMLGFVDPTNPELLSLAEELLALFNAAERPSRGQLEAGCEQLLEAFEGNALIARGLVKLVFDRARFQTPSDDDQPRFRAEVFATGAALLADAPLDTAEDYFAALEHRLGRPLETLRDSLYGDLSIHHPLERFRGLNPSRLLHRYNLALVQAVLMQAAQLEVELPETEPRLLRQLLKYLRFHQLFAEIRKTGARAFALRIDGPMALFGATRKYGLQLGRFLPGLLAQPRWRLRAELRPRGRAALLELDQDCGIRPGAARFHAYVPEGVTRFAESFGRKPSEWRLLEESEVIPLPGETYCFPDYLFIHADGRRAALELFHPWHKSHLLPRLRQLNAWAGVPLLLGVHKKLAGDRELAPLLAASAYFRDWGFVFNDLPTRRSVLDLLERLPESS